MIKQNATFSRFNWLDRANIVAMAAAVRRHHPEYPQITANMLAEMSDSEMSRLSSQLEHVLRSLGQLDR